MRSRFYIAAQLSLLLLLVAFPIAAQEASAEPDLLVPSSLTETAPDDYRVKFETSKGDVEIRVNRSWAPQGADRFYNLVKNGFYDDARFFRVVDGFIVQFGLPADPAVGKAWMSATIPDDPVRRPNRRSWVVFATAGPNTRTTQVFINTNNNEFLDDQGFAPFGQVTEGMNVVTNFNSEYGEAPDQGRIRTQGNAYLNAQFPNLDYIIKATIVE